MGNNLWLQDHGPNRKARLKAKGPHPSDGQVPVEIRRAAADDSRHASAVEASAYAERRLPPGGTVERYLAERRGGVRAFTLWRDPDRRERLAEVVTRSASRRGPAEYEVLGAAGEPLALVVRDPASFTTPRRTRWTVRQVDGTVAVGKKGNLFWWWVWWLLSPIQAVMLVLALLGGDVARPPRRTRWRIGGAVTLDFANGSTQFRLTEVDNRWDPRVTMALLALLHTHEGWIGSNWDDGKD